MSNSAPLYERINLFVFFKQLNFLKNQLIFCEVFSDSKIIIQK